MNKPIPPREFLKCPRCHHDIGGLLPYAEIRAWLERAERRKSKIQNRIRSSQRRKAVVYLRRLVVMETGKELNIEDGGRKLGLRELSQEIVKMLDLEMTEEACNEKQLDHLATKVEKKIIEYFTSSPR